MGGSELGRRWRVGGGLIVREGSILLVENLRRNGMVDWTPPGGVIDQGEEVEAGLSREVSEETGLNVVSWEGPQYTVDVFARDMGWHMTAEIYLATSVAGEVSVGDDPDGIVTAAKYFPDDELPERLDISPRWVSEPLLGWSEGAKAGATYGYEVLGKDPKTIKVTPM